MAELASLVIKVDSSGAVTGARNLQNLEKQGRKTESAVGSMGSTIKGALAQIGAAVSVAATIKKLVDISREFDVINASLITATGSAESAKVAFGAIQEFASQTPYDLQEVSKAFVQLVNYGLDPSERALTSYGNTASAMGKSLDQMIEAVADAATFEFERLKEFGIKARQEGDNVSFTFRGVTTTVKKNAQEIEEYLMRLGENEFAGAMEERAKTLDGALSNLGDTWDQLFLTISQQGTGSLIYESVMLAEQGLQSLIDLLASGQLEGYLNAYGSQFSAWGGDVAQTLDLVNGLFRDFSADVGQGGQDLVSFLSSAFGNMPTNVRAFIQIMTVELLAFIDKAGVYGKELMDRLTFWDDTYDHVGELEAVNRVRLSSIETILQERDAAVKSYEDQVQAARSLREEYDRQQAARAESTGGVLGQFGLGGGGADSGETGPGEKQLEQLSTYLQRQMEMIQTSMMTETEIINAEYVARMEKIAEARELGIETALSYDEMELLAAMDRENQLTELKRQSLDERLALEQRHNTTLANLQTAAANNAISLMSVLGNKNKAFAYAAIALQKGMSIAQVLMQSKVAAAAALTPPPIGLGPVAGAGLAASITGWGYANAAMIGAMGIAEAAAVGGSSGSVGGAVGSGSGAGYREPMQPSIPSRPEREQGQTVQVIFNGPVNGIDAQHITDTIKDAVNNSDFILIETTSRNGQMLAGR